MKFLLSVSVAIGVIAITGCDIKIDKPLIDIDKPSVDTNIGTNPTPTPAAQLLSCGTTVVGEGTFDMNREIVIRLRAVGGTPGYKLAGTSIQFAAETTISRTYNTPGQKTEYLTVRDTAGLTTECTFTVTISNNANPTDLACVLNAAPVNPHVDQNVLLTMTASGGTGTKTFYNLQPGDSVLPATLTATSATSASNTAKYSTAGAKTATVLVKDADDNVVSCSKSFEVRPALAATIAANVDSQDADKVILLTGSATGFLATDTLSYDYSVATSGVFLIESGQNAEVYSFNNVAIPNFVVTLKVKGTPSNEEITTTKTLSFVQNVPLNCSVSHSGSNLVVGDQLTYTVTASTGEALQIVDFNAGVGGSIVSSTDATRKVSYSSSGMKTATLTAKSKTRNVACNVGAQLSDSVQINNALACSAYTSYNPSYRYEYFNVWATVPANTGVGTVSIKQINYPTQAGLWDYYFNGALSAVFNFSNAGSWRIDIIVKDQSGKEATCSTTQVVRNF